MLAQLCRNLKEEVTDGRKLDDYHLPQVMDVTFECDGTEMHHIGKVLGC